MYITMLSTRYGSPDGFGVNYYRQGITYNVPDSLAYSFVNPLYGQSAARNATDKEITSLLESQDGRVAA